jgi:hypothetical protein
VRSPEIPAFELRFDINEVERWASRYQYADDTAVTVAGAKARARGWYSRAEFLTVTD